MQNERLSHREILRISEEFKSDLDMKKLPRQFMIDLAVYLNYPRYLVTLLKTDIIAFLLRATFNRILEDDLEIRREGLFVGEKKKNHNENEFNFCLFDC